VGPKVGPRGLAVWDSASSTGAIPGGLCPQVSGHARSGMGDPDLFVTKIEVSCQRHSIKPASCWCSLGRIQQLVPSAFDRGGLRLSGTPPDVFQQPVRNGPEPRCGCSRSSRGFGCQPHASRSAHCCIPRKWLGETGPRGSSPNGSIENTGWVVHHARD
jgi:hypothetical protein